MISKFSCTYVSWLKTILFDALFSVVYYATTVFFRLCGLRLHVESFGELESCYD